MSLGATQKLECWKPQLIPANEDELKAYRELVKQAVFSSWNLKHEPIDLAGIYKFVQNHVQDRLSEGSWPYSPYCRSKRFVDRRVNEVASPLFAENGKVKIVSVVAGVYQANPALFEPPKLKEGV